MNHYDQLILCILSLGWDKRKYLLFNMSPYYVVHIKTGTSRFIRLSTTDSGVNYYFMLESHGHRSCSPTYFPLYPCLSLFVPEPGSLGYKTGDRET